MKLFTSEQVAMGHPDKVCDQISDKLVSLYVAGDPKSRVAVETLFKDNCITVAGEVTSNADVDIEKAIYSVLSDVGIIDQAQWNITNLIGRQSQDIAQGVDVGGAGDQGIMWGYACDETPECLPLAYMLATQALLKLKRLNHKDLGADAKSQVTLAYMPDGTKLIHTFLMSVQHKEQLEQHDVKEIVLPLMEQTARDYGMNTDFRVLVNPTGKFVIGGSFGDCGVTGRKIIADTYGGAGHHGGGAFSGKDISKVDRSAAYMARYIAKYLLKKHSLHECNVQIAYAIGVDKPVSVYVENDTDGAMVREILEKFDLSPKGMIDFLDLTHADFYHAAKYGHFTNQNCTWEQVEV